MSRETILAINATLGKLIKYADGERGTEGVGREMRNGGRGLGMRDGGAGWERTGGGPDGCAHSPRRQSYSRCLCTSLLWRHDRYLNQHIDKLVMSEYDNAPPEYISLSKSG